MAKRTLAALLLLAVAVPAVIFGGILYFLIIAFFLVTAAWEYARMFRSAGYEPSVPIVLGGVAAVLLTRAFWPPVANFVFAVCILLAMTLHLIAYERGRGQAALDFGITIGGLTYLGWIGAYMLDLRALPDGGWWVMFVFPVVWLADSGAYSIGARYGRHRMSPRLSPRKTWEGYAAGILMGTLYGAVFAFAYTRFGPLRVDLWQGLLLGFVLSTLTTLGDLGESLFKRTTAFKDSGQLIPGHGGAFDRIDSLIWAAVIGVYWIQFFFL